MKKIIATLLLLFALTNLLFAQQKTIQLSLGLNPLDAYAAAEFKLSDYSTLYTTIGFGYGSVNAVNLYNYYHKNFQNRRNSDVSLPEIFFAPYLNIQYRNYYMRAKDNSKGDYTGNNSGMYIGARLKMFTAPVISLNDDVKGIKENYSLGLFIGNQKALGNKRRLVLNLNGGVSTHANYNLSFAVLKPMLHGSIAYIIK